MSQANQVCSFVTSLLFLGMVIAPIIWIYQPVSTATYVGAGTGDKISLYVVKEPADPVEKEKLYEVLKAKADQRVDQFAAIWKDLSSFDRAWLAQAPATSAIVDCYVGPSKDYWSEGACRGLIQSFNTDQVLFALDRSLVGRNLMFVVLFVGGIGLGTVQIRWPPTAMQGSSRAGSRFSSVELLAFGAASSLVAVMLFLICGASLKLYQISDDNTGGLVAAVHHAVTALWISGTYLTWSFIVMLRGFLKLSVLNSGGPSIGPKGDAIAG